MLRRNNKNKSDFTILVVEDDKGLNRLIQKKLHSENFRTNGALTGNDCINQSKEFNKAVDIDAIILTKADVDEKGGAAISVSYVTDKPIIYLGTGQNYKDIKEFSSEDMVESLGF